MRRGRAVPVDLVLNADLGIGLPRGSVVRPIKGEHPVGHCVYVIEVSFPTRTGGTMLKYKVGRTKNLNRRAAEHWAQLVGYVRLVYQRMCPNHKYLETCVQTGLGALKLESEFFISDPDEIIRTVEYCIKACQDLCNFTGKCAETDEEEEAKCMVGNLCQDLVPGIQKKRKPSRRRECNAVPPTT